MKYLIPLLLWSMVACAPISKDHFVFRGYIPGARDSIRVRLCPEDGSNSYIGYIVDEKIEFKGRVKGPTYCLLRLDNRTSARRNKEQEFPRDIYFFMENGDLYFETPHLDSLSIGYHRYDLRKEKNYTLKGSKTQDAFRRFQQQTIEHRHAIKELTKKSDVSQTPEDYQQLLRIQNEFWKMCRDFIRSQKNLEVNLFVAQQVHRYPLSYDLSDVEEMEALFVSYQDTCAMLRKYRESLQEAKRFVRGVQLEDAELVTPDGKRVKLLELLNKDGYTVIDNWASWCGACRMGLPGMKEFYKRYVDRVKFISVSSPGDREEGWKKAMKEENMSWEQYWDKDGQFSKFMKNACNVRTIPNIVLVASDGKIVHRGGNAGDIELHLKSLLQNK